MSCGYRKKKKRLSFERSRERERGKRGEVFEGFIFFFAPHAADAAKPKAAGFEAELALPSKVQAALAVTEETDVTALAQGGEKKTPPRAVVVVVVPPPPPPPLKPPLPAEAEAAAEGARVVVVVVVVVIPVSARTTERRAPAKRASAAR